LALRPHPVLAAVSRGYSELRGRFPRVTHPSATDRDTPSKTALLHAAARASLPHYSLPVKEQTALGIAASSRGAGHIRPGRHPVKPFRHDFHSFVEAAQKPYLTGLFRCPAKSRGHVQRTEKQIWETRSAMSSPRVEPGPAPRRIIRFLHSAPFRAMPFAAQKIRLQQHFSRTRYPCKSGQFR
jgi:hypothetical protein